MHGHVVVHRDSKSTVPLNVAVVERFARSFRNGQVLGSNISFDVVYCDCVFRGFSQFLQANVGWATYFHVIYK